MPLLPFFARPEALDAVDVEAMAVDACASLGDSANVKTMAGDSSVTRNTKETEADKWLTSSDGPTLRERWVRAACVRSEAFYGEVVPCLATGFRQQRKCSLIPT